MLNPARLVEAIEPDKVKVEVTPLEVPEPWVKWTPDVGPGIAEVKV